jgi:hypothetical protein
MRRSSLAAPLIVALAAAAGSCTDVCLCPTRAVAIEFDSLPFPAVVTGDSLRDSLGRVAPLKALALNASGELIQAAGVQYIALDTGITIDPTGVVTAQARDGTIRIVASVNGLQSPTRSLEVTRRPDTVVATSTRDTTLLFTIPDSALRNVTGMLGVKLVTADSAGGVAATKGWLVSYQVYFQGTPLSPRDTARASLWDDGTRITNVDTTAADGTAGRRLRVRSLLLPTKPDSFVVLATVRYRGGFVRGSPIRFVIRTQPR